MDQRWVRVRRPVIVTGGELSLGMLDLRYHQESNFYQAPIHFKANGGVFLIDDFGRQQCSPKELLNRWILPLEDRHDFLTVASGKKFQVPFEQLIIFSTNLDPKQLVDDAFLRRIRHKVGVNPPARDVYERIFAANCKRLGMNTDPSAIDFMYERYYTRGRSPEGQRLPRFAGNRPVDLSIQTATRASYARPDGRGGGEFHRRVHLMPAHAATHPEVGHGRPATSQVVCSPVASLVGALGCSNRNTVQTALGANPIGTPITGMAMSTPSKSFWGGSGKKLNAPTEIVAEPTRKGPAKPETYAILANVQFESAFDEQTIDGQPRDAARPGPPGIPEGPSTRSEEQDRASGIGEVLRPPGGTGKGRRDVQEVLRQSIPRTRMSLTKWRWPTPSGKTGPGRRRGVSSR